MKLIRSTLLALLCTAGIAKAQQQPPTGPTINQNSVTAQLAACAWYRGGNFLGNTGATRNIIGPFWNSPIYTYTDSQFRTVVNGTYNAPNLYPSGGATINTSGFFGVGTQSPYSPIHIGEDLPGGVGQGGGYRPWMTRGILAMFESDNIYVGLKDEGNDRSDAVVAWGDNPSGSTGSDNLRFIFAAPASIGSVASGINGVEVMHLNSLEQNVGIGPDFSNNSRPARRLEVQDANAGSSSSRAQFRITQSNPINNTLTDGTFSDFQVSNLGDLYIRPWNSAAGTGQQSRFVGIGLNPIGASAATEALDVNGNSRFRNIPAQGGQSLILGLQQGANGNDNELSRLAFTGNTNDVLLGNGTWGTIPTTGGGNGFALCTDPIGDALLTGNSRVNLNNQQLYFENNDALDLNHTGFGYSCGDELPAKVSVKQVHPALVPINTTGISGINKDVTSGFLKTYTGIYGQASEMQDINLRPTMVGGDFVAGNGALNYGVRASILNTAQAAETNVGFKAEIDDANSTINLGADLQARNSMQNVGIRAHGIRSSFQAGSQGYGGEFVAYGNDLRNVGINAHASITTPGGQENFGVIGNASNGNANYGIYGTTGGGGGANFAGYFAGDVEITGALILSSDQKFKKEINDLDGALETLAQLKPKTYYFDTESYPNFNFESDLQMGLIAQDLAEVLPDLVEAQVHPAQYDTEGKLIAESTEYFGVQYSELIPLLIAGVNEQQAEIVSQKEEIASKNAMIEDLNARLTKLENCLSGILPSLCELGNAVVQPTDDEIKTELAKAINVELSSKDNIVLSQNVPNPFAESTTIRYSIPSSVKSAQINFYDGTGKLIKTVELNERGAGQINVFGSDLSSGVYTYSLIADGQAVSTKRMVKE